MRITCIDLRKKLLKLFFIEDERVLKYDLVTENLCGMAPSNFSIIRIIFNWDIGTCMYTKYNYYIISETLLLSYENKIAYVLICVLICDCFNE